MLQSELTEEPLYTIPIGEYLTQKQDNETYRHVYDSNFIHCTVLESRRIFALNEEKINEINNSIPYTKTNRWTNINNNTTKYESSSLFSYNYNIPSVGTSSISTWDETDQYINLGECQEIHIDKFGMKTYDFTFEQRANIEDYQDIPNDEEEVLLLSDSPDAIYVAQRAENINTEQNDIAFYDKLYDNPTQHSSLKDTPISLNLKSESLIHTQPHRLVSPRSLVSHIGKDKCNDSNFKVTKKVLSKTSATSSFSSVFSYNEDHLQKIITEKEPLTKPKEVFFSGAQSNTALKKKTISNNKHNIPEKLKLINYLTIGNLKFKYFYYYDPDEGNPILVPEYPPLMTVDLIAKPKLIKKKKIKDKKKKSKKGQISKKLSKGHNSEDQTRFFNTLRLKLDRYCGNATGRRSRSQDYFDKVRFQEIFYKFSKTYF
ncbi:hypothetical protein RNJ44_01568 [Nakaseomyces bracarensis]|uniref:Uncharacterized protein n=1 Tax=Nakaseomyces bracarensis TaxID=273131 RepID=A0ABR4NQ42_9SACH